MEQTRETVLRSEIELTNQIRELEQKLPGLPAEGRKQVFLDILKLVGAIDE
jgi:hypothetical protein